MADTKRCLFFTLPTPFGESKAATTITKNQLRGGIHRFLSLFSTK
jgi:hypothetical protein